MIAADHKFLTRKASDFLEVVECFINLTTQVNALTGENQSIEHQCILAFGGTRGYICPDDASFEPDTDQSIYDREILRTEAALQEMEHANPSVAKRTR